MQHFNIGGYDIVIHNGCLDIFHQETFICSFLPTDTEALLDALNLNREEIRQAAYRDQEASRHENSNEPYQREEYFDSRAIEIRKKIWMSIERSGYFTMGVAGTPPFAYTIGLHPELVIIGVSLDDVPEIFHRIVQHQKQGLVLESHKTYTDTGILDKLPFYTHQVDHNYYEQYAPAAIRWYHSRDFPFLQVIWPSPQGYFPWQPGYDEALRADQPVLFQPPQPQ